MFNKLKSLFIVEEEEPAKKKTSTAKKATESVAKSTKSNDQFADKTVSYNQNDAAINIESGDVDEKITDKLLKAVEKHNQSGFDYIEFKKSLQALEKMPMDEETKYRSAFATAATIGATLPNLVKSAEFYIGIIDKENSNFLSSFDVQYNAKIAAKEKEMLVVEQQIKEKTEQLRIINEEIAAHKSNIEEVNEKLGSSKVMMQNTQQKFKVSYYNLRSQFEADIQKMEKYLK